MNGNHKEWYYITFFMKQKKNRTQKEIYEKNRNENTKWKVEIKIKIKIKTTTKKDVLILSVLKTCLHIII